MIGDFLASFELKVILDMGNKTLADWVAKLPVQILGDLQNYLKDFVTENGTCSLPQLPLEFNCTEVNIVLNKGNKISCIYLL